MKLVGKSLPGITPVDLAADSKTVARYTLGRDATIVKLSVYVDGFGLGAGDQVMRGVIYDTAGNLLGQSDEVLVLDGQAAGWVDLAFAVGVKLLAADYDFGVIGGPQDSSVRLYTDLAIGAGRANTDSYANGASASFGSATVLDSDLSIFGTYTTAWVPPSGLPDLELARLPWSAAQKALSGGVNPPIPASLGWYGSAFDKDATGAFVLVRDGGKLAALVGERLGISLGSRLVYAYCKAAAVLNSDEDLAVPRRAYSALSLPTIVPVQVEVSVIAS